MPSFHAFRGLSTWHPRIYTLSLKNHRKHKHDQHHGFGKRGHEEEREEKKGENRRYVSHIIVWHCPLTRTAVSSSSGSSSDSDSSSDEGPAPKGSQQNSDANLHDKANSSGDDVSSPAGSPILATRQPRQDPEQAFEAFYLKQTTREFSEDLEKLRAANDFKGQRSVELLVGALKQGTTTFSKDERKAVVETH